MTTSIYRRPQLLDATRFPGLVCFIYEGPNDNRVRPHVSNGQQWQPLGGMSISAADVAALKAASTPIVPGITIVDPASPYSVLGTVDGAGDIQAGGEGGGGASTFVALTDTPSSLSPSSVLAVNDAGTEVENKPWIEALGNNDYTSLTLRPQIPDTNELGISFFVEGSAGKFVAYADAYGASMEVVRTSGARLYFAVTEANATRVVANLSGGNLVWQGLPTADPNVVGALWSNSGVLTLSAG
jgi:hypothetical protein